MSALIVRVEHLQNIDASCHHAGIIVGDHTTELVAVELVDMFSMSLTNCIVGKSLPIIYQRTGAEASCFPRHNFKTVEPCAHSDKPNPICSRPGHFNLESGRSKRFQ